MNTETGEIYRGAAAIAAAEARGEPLARVSDRVAALMEEAQQARAEVHRLRLAHQALERAKAEARRQAKRRRRNRA